MVPGTRAAGSACGNFPTRKGEGNAARTCTDHRSQATRSPSPRGPGPEGASGRVRRRGGPVGAGPAPESRPRSRQEQGRGLAGGLPESPRLALRLPPRSRGRQCRQELPRRPSSPDVRPGGQAGLEGRAVHPPVRWREGGESARLQLPTTSLSSSHDTERRRHWLRGDSRHTKRDGRWLLRRVLRDKWLHRNGVAPSKKGWSPAAGNCSPSAIYLRKAEDKE